MLIVYKMAKPNAFQIFFLFFLLVAFVAGVYVHSTMDLKYMIAKSEGFVVEGLTDAPAPPASAPVPEGCPDLLIQRGSGLFLYYSKQPAVDGKNPLIFKSLEEYGNYMKGQPACPILFLQQENNAQGNDVYRVRPSPFNPFAGMPANSALLKPYDGAVIQVVDASRENGYNQGMYPGFDPQGLYVGRTTNVDVVHQSTETEAILSDNPMDSNWGGVLFTQGQLESGKYEENEVVKPVFPQVRNRIPAFQ